MEIYISTYEKFRQKLIPENIMCIGVSKEIPEDFQTTTIHNFLYTPKSILGASYNAIVKPEEFVELYKTHLKQKVQMMGYQSLNEYFSKMLRSFDNGERKAICFLDEENGHWYDTAVVLKNILNELGFTVTEYSKRVKPKNDSALF